MDIDEDVRRNERLTANIAAGRSPLTPGIEETMRGFVDAGMDVPGPRVGQLFAEVDRLRAAIDRVRTAAFAAWGDPLANPGSTATAQRILAALDKETSNA